MVQFNLRINYSCGHEGTVQVDETDAVAVREFCKEKEACPKCRWERHKEAVEIAKDMEQGDYKEAPF